MASGLLPATAADEEEEEDEEAVQPVPAPPEAAPAAGFGPAAAALGSELGADGLASSAVASLRFPLAAYLRRGANRH